MRLSHIALKPTVRTLATINGDQPDNGELFAELMYGLQDLVKGRIQLPRWVDYRTALAQDKEAIRSLLWEGR